MTDRTADDFESEAESETVRFFRRLDKTEFDSIMRCMVICPNDDEDKITELIYVAGDVAADRGMPPLSKTDERAIRKHYWRLKNLDQNTDPSDQDIESQPQ